MLTAEEARQLMKYNNPDGNLKHHIRLIEAIILGAIERGQTGVDTTINIGDYPYMPQFLESKGYKVKNIGQTASDGCDKFEISWMNNGGG